MKKNRRPQAQKRTTDHQRYVTDLRSSNAAMPHKSSTDYRRRPKHMGKGWS
jgi:hypothetical protein